MLTCKGQAKDGFAIYHAEAHDPLTYEQCRERPFVQSGDGRVGRAPTFSYDPLKRTPYQEPLSRKR